MRQPTLPTVERRGNEIPMTAGFTILPSAPFAVQAAHEQKTFAYIVDDPQLNPLGSQRI